MEQALATAVPLAVAPGPLDRLVAMPAGAKMKLGVGLAGLVAVIVAIGLWSSQGDYGVLFANLPDKEGGAVVAQLATMQVPYKFAAGGTAIMIPADKVNEVRLKLAVRRPAQVQRHRLRADGQRQVRPDPDPGTREPAARARRRAHPHDQLHRRRRVGPRPPGAAQPERLLPRAAEAQRLRGADAARRPHARPLAAGRHRPPGGLQRARAADPRTSACSTRPARC